MLRTTTNFDTANELKQKQPVWIVDFDGIATKFSSGEFGDITGSYKKYLKDLTIKPMKIDLLKFHTEFFGVSFTIIEDTALTVLSIINNNTMRDLQVTIKIGYQSLNLADFAEYQYCLIEDFSYKSKLNEWVFNAKNPYNKIKRPIFGGLGRTDLTADTAYGDTAFNVTSTAGFQSVGSAPWASVTTETYLQVGSDIGEYIPVGMTATRFTVSSTNRFGEKSAHSDGESVTEVIRTDDNPANLLLWILTTTSAGTNGNFDLGLSDWGMGIDVDYVDTNQILNECGSFGKWELLYNYLIAIDNNIEDGFKWIEKYILPSLPGYFFITRDSKIGVKVWDVFGDGEGDLSIGNDEILRSPDLKSEETKIITAVELKDRAFPVINRFLYNDVYDKYTCDSLDTEYGELFGPLLNMNSDRVSPTTAKKESIMQRYFGRMGSPVGRIKMKTFLEHQIIQGGDLINVTYEDLPLLRTGAMGWTSETVELTNATISYKTGKIQPELVADNILNSERVDLQDINVVPLAQIDDPDLSKDADHAAGTLQAADAYYDNTAYTATDIMVEVELTQPGNAGGSNERYIVLYLKIQNPAGTDIQERECRFYYDERESTTRKAQFYAQDLTAAVYARVRVDWTGTSGGTEPSSVSVKKIKFWHFKSTITKTSV